MDSDAFEHHLLSPQGLRRVPAGAVTREAGAGGCCDRISISLALEGDTVTDAGFAAEGCGAATAAASAAVTLVRGRPLLEVARLGPGQISAELGGLSPAKLHAAEVVSDALHRALGEAARTATVAAPPAGRTLVAMSGGVDSAVAALLSADAGEVVAVTLELWADPENDAERSCCSASAVAVARAMAHRMGLAHLTLDLRDEFRAGVVEPFIAGYGAGETPNPCVGCNGHVRLDAMLALADRLGCEHLVTGHYARVADEGHEHGPLLRLAADRSKDQTYMLAGLRPASLARMRFPLGGLTKPEVRQIAAEAGLSGGRARPTHRTCASWPAPTGPGSWPATEASAIARATSSTATAPCSPGTRPAPLHRRPAQGDRRRQRRAAVRARQGRAFQPRHGRSPLGSADRPGRRPRRAPAPRRRPRRPRQAALPLDAAARAADGRPTGRLAIER